MEKKAIKWCEYFAMWKKMCTFAAAFVGNESDKA